MHSQIETVHRCRIFYDMDSENMCRVEDFITKVERFAFRLNGIEVDTFSGNAAFSPWVLLECHDRISLVNVVERVECYIQRWRGAKLE